MIWCPQELPFDLMAGTTQHLEMMPWQLGSPWSHDPYHDISSPYANTIKHWLWWWPLGLCRCLHL